MIPLVTASEEGQAQILNLLGFTWPSCNLKKRFLRSWSAQVLLNEASWRVIIPSG